MSTFKIGTSVQCILTLSILKLMVVFKVPSHCQTGMDVEFYTRYTAHSAICWNHLVVTVLKKFSKQKVSRLKIAFEAPNK